MVGFVRRQNRQASPQSLCEGRRSCAFPRLRGRNFLSRCRVRSFVSAFVRELAGLSPLFALNVSFVLFFLSFALFCFSFPLRCMYFLFLFNFILSIRVYMRFRYRSRVGQSVNADAAAAFAPGVAVALQEHFDTGGQSMSRGTPTGVLSTNMTLVAHHNVGESVKVLPLQLF